MLFGVRFKPIVRQPGYVFRDDNSNALYTYCIVPERESSGPDRDILSSDVGHSVVIFLQSK